MVSATDDFQGRGRFLPFTFASTAFVHKLFGLLNAHELIALIKGYPMVAVAGLCDDLGESYARKTSIFEISPFFRPYLLLWPISQNPTK